MSVFIQFLVDYLWLTIGVGIVVLGIIGVGTALIVCTVRRKTKTKGADLAPPSEKKPSD